MAQSSVGNRTSALDEMSKKHFYGLLRNDDGEIFFTKVNASDPDAVLTVNFPGDPKDNYPNFEFGDDFYEGRNAQHNIVYKNLAFEQFRFHDMNGYYYINEEGELVFKHNRPHTYEEGTSSDKKVIGQNKGVTED